MEGDNPFTSSDDLIPAAASATCDALFRCCTTEDELERFFLPVTASDPTGPWADVIPRLPPNASLSADQCPGAMELIYRAKGLGPFMDAVANGLVQYDAAAATCARTLEGAACGDEVLAALYDGTCFGIGPPEGGESQRSMFARTATDGACRPLADGFGGLLYGTCDPTRAFCCVAEDGGPCGFPGDDDEGTWSIRA